jgi:hypothetical protein
MLDALNAPDVAYSVRRLVRGIASPRESSRLGFAVALTEVCTKLPFMSMIHDENVTSCFPVSRRFLARKF